ncbi:MAG: EamA family transporter [Leptolyngbya sp. ERB_1_1]
MSVRRISPQLYLWIAILIFGASSSVTRKLTLIGDRHSINGHNPISFCNILFVGNLCALLLFSLIYHRQWRIRQLRAIPRRTWIVLTIVAVFSGAIAPGLIFQALAFSSVNDVILIGRLEPLLVLLLSIAWLKERVTAWEILGAMVTFLGVTLTVVLQPHLLNAAAPQANLGKLFVAIAALLLAISTLISKAKLSHVSVGTHNLYRTLIGTITFYCIALIVYGSDHFTDAFSPFVWKWMLLYAGVIVVLGQTFWLRGLRATSIAKVTLANAFTPIAGILAAFLVLGERPTSAQWIGGSIILLGIILSQIGIWRRKSDLMMLAHNSASRQALENNIGFMRL